MPPLDRKEIGLPGLRRVKYRRRDQGNASGIGIPGPGERGASPQRETHGNPPPPPPQEAAHLGSLPDEEPILAYEADGEPLAPEHGWALRRVIPKRYFWKSAEWLRGIELLDRDGPDFWERLGHHNDHHNDADYWKEERYGF
jgi:DMSO/TMAO reductase YedYZ molybdopterin-dependent catalytic subunit